MHEPDGIPDSCMQMLHVTSAVERKLGQRLKQQAGASQPVQQGEAGTSGPPLQFPACKASLRSQALAVSAEVANAA